jgi:hypothetical protein
MPCNKWLCMGIVVMLALFIGCSKHDKQNAMKKGAELPAMGKKSALDTSDIFKEFYSDDTAGQGETKKSSGKASLKGKTFSPASSAASASGEFSQNGRYVVQVSCVLSKSFAEKIASSLQEKNFPAYTAAVQNPTPQLSGTYYRVRIGGFTGISAAKSFGENSLVAAGYDYWVDKKSNDNVGMEGYGLGGSASASPASSYENTAPATSSWQSPGESGTSSASSPAPSSESTVSPAGSSASPAPAAGSAAPSATPAPAAEKASPAPASASRAPAAEKASQAPASSSAPKPSPEKKDESATSRSSEWGSDSSSGGW